MATGLTTQPHLELEPIAGPPVPAIAPIEIAPDQTMTLGRGLDCGICLADPEVSRRHALIASAPGPAPGSAPASGLAGRWFITDLGSRHGTILNGVKLAADQPTALADSDLLSIGPWTFRVRMGGRAQPAATIDDSALAAQRVERLADSELESIAQHRLNLLIECAGAITGAGDEQTLAVAALDSAIAGSGFPRASLIRPLGAGEDMELVASRSADGVVRTGPAFSRSLLREASTGQLARLTAHTSPPPANRLGESVAQMGIHSALCAPIMLGSTIAAYLYLDARGGELPVELDAAGFCQAIARVFGLALANLKRVELEGRHARLQADLAAAREAQQLIMPPESGSLNGIRYAVRMRPGMIVAGDLFDVVPMPDGRVAVCIGDVSGEGIGAAILMATTQSHLHAALLGSGDPAQALNAVNDYLARHMALNMFVTMWVGVIDTKTGTVTHVDAGHGHWLLKPASAAARQVDRPSGPPLGIQSLFAYRAATLPVNQGDRLILFSDGLTEQKSPAGEQFGLQRVLEVIDNSTSAEQDVSSLLRAMELFAGRSIPGDDTTVASVEICDPNGDMSPPLSEVADPPTLKEW